MVKNERIFIGCLSTLVGVILAFPVKSGLPTFDFGVFGQAITTVKNGAENLKGIKGITEKSGELNSIVGDAVGTVSKFKEEYGEDIEKSVALAKSAQERLDAAKNQLSEYQTDLQDRKDEYQGLLDKVAGSKNLLSSGSSSSTPTDEVTPIYDASQGGLITDTPSTYTSTSSSVTSDAKNYDDGREEAERFVIEWGEGEWATPPSDTAVSYEEEVAARASQGIVDGTFTAETVSAISATTSTSAPVRSFRKPPTNNLETETRVINSTVSTNEAVSSNVSVTPALAVSSSVSTNTSNVSNQAVQAVEATRATPAAAVILDENAAVISEPRRGFRTRAVQRKNTEDLIIDKISSSRFHSSENVAFAIEATGVGNQYVNDMFVVPAAQICEIEAVDYIENESVRKECHERIIKAMSSPNQFDQKEGMDNCLKMNHQTTIALKSEAALARYEAANYQQVLDQQDEIAAKCADLRCDLAMIVDSLSKEQVLFNNMGAILSGDLLMNATGQICGIQAEVIGLDVESGE